jgi:hypothetical protein
VGAQEGLSERFPRVGHLKAPGGSLVGLPGAFRCACGLAGRGKVGFDQLGLSFEPKIEGCNFMIMPESIAAQGF